MTYQRRCDNVNTFINIVGFGTFHLAKSKSSDITTSHKWLPVGGFRWATFLWCSYMQVKRTIISKCKGQPMLQKALAFALFLKSKLDRSCSIPNYTINKIHEITGIPATTIKKYLPTLAQQGWITFGGKNNQHLFISNLCSSNDKRNIKTDMFVWDSFKNVIRSIRAFIALAIQARKNFVKRTLQALANPVNDKDFKATKRLVKRLVKQGVLDSRYQTYKEYGLSLKRIAKEIGMCVRTTQTIMNFALEQKYVAKYHNFEQICAKNVHYLNIEGYTFTTNNNMYIIKANLYVLSNDIDNALSYAGIILDGKK